ncbi:MAG: c-type cytochrome [Magnetospiraceae bacterium]
MIKKFAAIACVTLGLAACTGMQDNAAAKHDSEFYTPTDAQTAAGLQVFSRCKGCHSLDPSKNTFGPNLRGVYMRPAASLPRFQYSEALKGSGIVWNEENLRSWIAGNDVFVGGTRMRHVAIADALEQDYLLAFLKSFK